MSDSIVAIQSAALWSFVVIRAKRFSDSLARCKESDGNAICCVRSTCRAKLPATVTCVLYPIHGHLVWN